MHKKLFFYLSIIAICCSSLTFADSPSLKRVEPKIFVNNRILANINGKPITTYDLVKKMDLTFYKQYPEYVSSNEARYQFYSQGWKIILDDLVNEELVLADAKESKIEVSAGDVRQEMEQQFGPNIIENLDKAGMTLDEAYKIVEAELLLQRTIGARVNVKALRAVTPATIRKTYEEYIQKPENKNLTKWDYRVLTIKDRDVKKSEVLSQVVYQLLAEGISLEKIEETMKSRQLLGKNGKVTISKTITNDEQELTENYKKALEHLKVGQFSHPFPFKSRVLKATVYRIIFVDAIFLGGYPTYKELEPKIKQFLINQAADKETEAYILKLRQHYHVRDSDLQKMIPENYQPFTLK